MCWRGGAGGGTFHWHSECSFSKHSRLAMATQHTYINRCDEQKNFGQLLELFIRRLACPPPPLSLPTPLQLMRFICFTIFFNYFNATNMSAYFVLKGIFAVFFFCFYDFYFCQFTTHAHTHARRANCVTVQMLAGREGAAD